MTSTNARNMDARGTTPGGYRSGRTCASAMFRGGTISGRRIASHRLHVQRAPIAQITRVIDYLCISPLAGPAIVRLASFPETDTNEPWKFGI